MVLLDYLYLIFQRNDYPLFSESVSEKIIQNETQYAQYNVNTHTGPVHGNDYNLQSFGSFGTRRKLKRAFKSNITKKESFGHFAAEKFTNFSNL